MSILKEIPIIMPDGIQVNELYNFLVDNRMCGKLTSGKLPVTEYSKQYTTHDVCTIRPETTIGFIISADLNERNPTITIKLVEHIEKVITKLDNSFTFYAVPRIIADSKNNKILNFITFDILACEN